ncbi:hypothetical protein H4S04_000018 [Coemansia sp. S16]|nr:hypothetical protein H4S04_000018 [Coemansia sp. S16]
MSVSQLPYEEHTGPMEESASDTNHYKLIRLPNNLVLSIKDHETFGYYADVSHTNFATIGMEKTPDGIWLMTDYRKFQATQKLYGLGLSDVAIDQVPKYN